MEQYIGNKRILYHHFLQAAVFEWQRKKVKVLMKIIYLIFKITFSKPSNFIDTIKPTLKVYKVISDLLRVSFCIMRCLWDNCLSECFSETCDEGWSYFGSECLLFSTDKLSLLTSHEQCVKFGGYIAYINSQEEFELLLETWNKLTMVHKPNKW